MKKSLVVLAALASFAGAAAAQSSVTLFGTVDLAARYVKANGQNVKKLSRDGLSSSRLGVRGVEDLGGGLKAGFWLEGELSADTGAAGSAFWGRRATLSLMGDFGEVRLGRAKTSARLVVDDFDVYGTVGQGSVANLYSGFNVLGTALASNSYKVSPINRSDNQVQYLLPGDLGGIYGSFDVAAGEGTDGKKAIGGRLGYQAGPLHVAAGYQTVDVASSKYKMFVLGGSYDFGVVKANVMWTQNKFLGNRQNVITVGAVVPVTSAGSVTAQFTNAAGNATADLNKGGDAKLYTVGYQHNLSKRTALYTTVSLIDNGKTGMYALTDSPAVAANGRSGSVDVGIRHSF